MFSFCCHTENVIFVLIPTFSFFSQRKCLFKDELIENFHGMYSYSACIVRCRIKVIQSLCKCTPYFLPAGKAEGPVCSMDDLRCLNKYKGTESFWEIDLKILGQRDIGSCSIDQGKIMSYNGTGRLGNRAAISQLLMMVRGK